ncbi:MAG: ABC transporter permease [Halobacteriales archaeon]|nr:ABC transporter permease [Halobacteriales archaeon]
MGGDLAVRDHFIVRNIEGGMRQLWAENMSRFAIIWLTIVVFVALFGGMIAPYEYNERVYADDGSIKMAERPTIAHPLGTTDRGYDVLSRILVGTQPTALAGFLGGGMILTIGLSIALASGWMGGRTDDVLMRFTDIVYSIPLIPFALVILAFFGGGFLVAVLVIGVLLWRSVARVLRAQVLGIKERPFVLASKSTGASSFRLVFKHIFPNVAPMAMLFFALGTGWAIIAQASLAFIGVSNPFLPSWGVMIRNAYNSGYMGEIWTWSMMPGILIALTVLSCFLVGRAFESDEGMAHQAGGT